jgi:hypothetical protein
LAFGSFWVFLPLLLFILILQNILGLQEGSVGGGGRAFYLGYYDKMRGAGPHMASVYDGFLQTAEGHSCAGEWRMRGEPSLQVTPALTHQGQDCLRSYHSFCLTHFSALCAWHSAWHTSAGEKLLSLSLVRMKLKVYQTK